MSAPPITEPLLRERLGMDDAAFRTFITETFRSLPARRVTPEVLTTPLGYPWERPTGSFLLEGERVLAPDAALTREPGRHALLAIGSNGAPATLARKLAHLPDEDRRVLCLTGALHGFDVGPAAHPTAYGSMPATLFESPGTAVRAAVLWVTSAAFTQLSWTELTYRLGRLEGVRFACDEAGVDVDGVWAFASRWGAFCPDGAPLALAAIPAEGRTAPALGQRELLDRAAVVMGLGDAEALVRALLEAPAGLLDEASPRIAATGRPLTAAAWRPWSPRS